MEVSLVVVPNFLREKCSVEGIMRTDHFLNKLFERKLYQSCWYNCDMNKQ